MATWYFLTCWGSWWWLTQLALAPSSTTWWPRQLFCIWPRKRHDRVMEVGERFVDVISCTGFVLLSVSCFFSLSLNELNHSISLRRSLRSRSGLRHRRSGPELVRHPALSADRSSGRDFAGPLHVLVQSLLHLHLPVWSRCHGQDHPHSHAGQELVLWSK